MSVPIVEDNRCAKCRWHSKDGLFCENPNSYFYGWFRNDWKRCDKYEEQEAQDKTWMPLPEPYKGEEDA